MTFAPMAPALFRPITRRPEWPFWPGLKDLCVAIPRRSKAHGSDFCEGRNEGARSARSRPGAYIAGGVQQRVPNRRAARVPAVARRSRLRLVENFRESHGIRMLSERRGSRHPFRTETHGEFAAW